MSFSSKNDAESFRNFIKKQVLDPKRAKLVQKSLRKVYGKYTESSKTSKTCPGRPIRAHMGPYGPTWAHIWAHKGPYGPQPGPGPNPDWAPTRPGPYQNLFLCIFWGQGFKARTGLGPSPGWGLVRVGAHMGLYGPIKDPKGMILFENH